MKEWIKAIIIGMVSSVVVILFLLGMFNVIMLLHEGHYAQGVILGFVMMSALITSLYKYMP